MKKIWLILFLIFSFMIPANLYAHNEQTMSQNIYICPLTKKWNDYERANNIGIKKQELSCLKETAINHNFITPVTQLRAEQESIIHSLIHAINELDEVLNRDEIDVEKRHLLEIKIQELIFSHLEFEKTVSDFKSDQFWKMTRIVLLVLLVFIFTTIFLTFIYNSAKRRARKANEFNNQMIKVQEEERQRLSRELHDTVTQDIRTNLLYIRNLREHINSEEEVEDLLNRIERLESQNLISIRNIIRNLTPPEIETSNLNNLLAEYCNNISQMTNIKCTYYAEKGIYFEKLNGIQKLNIFRIIQEAVTNAIKHADATEINIIVRKESENSSNLLFFISDDGHGFMKKSIPQQDKDIVNQSTHLGLQGMKTRAQLLNAKMDIISDEESGTEVRIVVPLFSIS